MRLDSSSFRILLKSLNHIFHPILSDIFNFSKKEHICITGYGSLCYVYPRLSDHCVRDHYAQLIIRGASGFDFQTKQQKHKKICKMVKILIFCFTKIRVWPHSKITAVAELEKIYNGKNVVYATFHQLFILGHFVGRQKTS